MGPLQNIAEDQIAVGVFHITAHIPECQVKYHPRLRTGFGLKDGEWLERLWSYLNGFVSTTRYMTPLNRRLTLTVALSTFARQRMENIGKDALMIQSKGLLKLELAVVLARKYKHALAVKADAEAALGNHDQAALKLKWDNWVQKSFAQPSPRGGKMGALVNAMDKLRVAVGIYDIITHAFRKQGNGMLRFRYGLNMYYSHSLIGHNQTQNLSSQKELAYDDVVKKLEAYNALANETCVIGKDMRE